MKLGLFTRIMAFFVVSFMLATFPAAAQTSLVQTSLSSAVTGRFSTQYTVYLASTTGVSAANNGQPQTTLYVDQEAMGVLSVSGTAVTVLRGQFGTKQSSHASGAMVLVGPNNAFATTDPPINGSCTGNDAPQYTPVVNVLTGAQWLCSSVTGTWVAGFNNDMPSNITAAVASAAGLITPSGPLFHVTGTAAVTGFNIPVGFNKGQICAIPDALGSFTAATNLAKATTSVVSQTICWTYDPSTAKFYPSY